MEIEVLSASLILVASLCGGLCAVFIARSKSTVNKHSRQRIKDFENDIQYLAESKKEEAKDYRQEILRLKSSINRIKEGPAVTETDMKNSGGLSDIIMQLAPAKYKGVVKHFLPQVEEAIKKDPTIVERVYEKIKSANTSNKQAQAEPAAQASTSL